MSALVLVFHNFQLHTSQATQANVFASIIAQDSHDTRASGTCRFVQSGTYVECLKNYLQILPNMHTTTSTYYSILVKFVSQMPID